MGVRKGGIWGGRERGRRGTWRCSCKHSCLGGRGRCEWQREQVTCSISLLQPLGFGSESPPGTQGCCPGTSLCPPMTVPVPLGCSRLRVALPSTAECSPPSPSLPHPLQPSAGWERSKEGPCPPSPPGTLPHCRVPRGWAGSHRQLRCRPDPGHKSSPKVQQALEADLILISFSPLKIEPLIPSSKHSPTLSPPPFSLSLPVPPPASHWGQQGSATSSVIICPLPCNFFFQGNEAA